MKLGKYLFALMVLVLAMNSCQKDDDSDVQAAPPRDRGEQYLVDLDSIEEYLSTHFYNYEEFATNPNSTDFEILFDTIAGDNSDKTPLIDQVSSKMVLDADDVEYKLYYLVVREGLGDQPKFADSTYLDYKGTLINDTTFDSSPNPVWFDLVSVVQGFREIAKEFKGSTSFVENPDGTFTYQDYGIGAMFIPSGLAYFNEPPFGVPLYSPLVFRFNLYLANESDHDRDHVPSYLEDLDGNENFSLAGDDTDEDNLADFVDADDDNDGTLTRDEDLEPDPDLSVDSNGDGDPTNDIGDGNPMNDDTDGDGIPNYLDPDDSESRFPDDDN
ncbi:MAG: hypothetical protein HKN96_11425 [Flavobacteriaceae bacterium]|nr:hypothetical protein [Flavobacteriaceae bacterium]